MTDTQSFFEHLAPFTDFQLFSDPSVYQSLPEDWLIVVADIKGSTVAIEAGQYKDVNSISGSVVVAVLNAIGHRSIPFVFGGDGASFCIHPSDIQAVSEALLGTKKMAQDAFSLHLRIGMVPFNLISSQSVLKVAKYKSSEHNHQAMFLGGALQLAETLIKQPDSQYLIDEHAFASKADFSGFECRWNEFKSPKQETIALMIQVLDTDNQQSHYQGIYQKICEIYGGIHEYNPISIDKMSLSLSILKILKEIKIKFNRIGFMKKINILAKSWTLILIGKYLIAKKITTDSTQWGEYKTRFIENSDFQKFDETLRMIISGSKQQRLELMKYLDLCHQQKLLVYGIHQTDAAIATCMVIDYQHRHFHFIDANNGGYAMAAKHLKLQLKQI
ncbi:DUF3095 domain-containing protein [Marinicellulosiphila megalodicopiae]|uniref:DUF3095 domain-containing protein n=1 Tax=Marinicellulosiphila megalodicopiae TaxID=2724896 RepID=UPI003BAF9DF5